jgi:hypothetical protein
LGPVVHQSYISDPKVIRGISTCLPFTIDAWKDNKFDISDPKVIRGISTRRRQSVELGRTGDYISDPKVIRGISTAASIEQAIESAAKYQ